MKQCPETSAVAELISGFARRLKQLRRKWHEHDRERQPAQIFDGRRCRGGGACSLGWVFSPTLILCPAPPPPQPAPTTRQTTTLLLAFTSPSPARRTAKWVTVNSPALRRNCQSSLKKS